MIVGTKIKWNDQSGGDIEECVRIQKTKDGFVYYFNKEGEDFNTWLGESQIAKLKEHNIIEEISGV